MGTKLYVGNLSFRTTSDELKDLFSQAGEVESASVIEDRETGRSRGFGFVEMATAEGGAAAITQFNGYELGGRALTVNEAAPKLIVVAAAARAVTEAFVVAAEVVATEVADLAVACGDATPRW